MIHVFVGPTLPPTEPVLSLPGVRVWPPVRHGDLFARALRSGDTAVLIDGVFHQAPALRHKEIIAAMDRGVRVVGAASIGALRAAELAPYGMIGVGAVYAAYARGEIDGDDEVAVGQASDGDWASVTWPLVNLRHILGLAKAAGVLDAPRAAALLEAWRTVYYPQRTTSAVRAVCRTHDEAEFATWFAGQRLRDRHFADLKRTDALAAVHGALDGTFDPESGTTPGRGAPSGKSAPVPVSAYLARWSNAFACETFDERELRTEDRVVYQQVFDPGFKDRWTAYLEHRSRQPDAHGTSLSLQERLDRATDGGLPAHRVFHPAIDLQDAASTALLLAGETAEDRAAVARYADVLALARRTRPGFFAAAVSDGLTRRVLLQLWRCQAEGFDDEASARGLRSGTSAVHAAKRLIPGFLDVTRHGGEQRGAAGQGGTRANR